MTVLDRILERKVEEVRALRRRPGEPALLREASALPPARGFAAALRQGPRPRVIAEFKRASPSRGMLRAEADPAVLARAYATAGACALSVLTDRDFFCGGLEDLRAARAACALPALRKDFTIDPIQVVEARAAGADAVLLIVAALDEDSLRECLQCARAQKLDALVEVHTRAELERALEADAELIGINNRDLRTFQTDVGVTRALLPFVGGRLVVSESGLDRAETLAELEQLGVEAFLIGEALLREPDPGVALRRLRGLE